MKRQRSGREVRPEDVIAGRVRINVQELLELIARVNPTGRTMSAKERALRYSQKSALQSLLVRRFAEELDVVSDPVDEKVISLRHHPTNRDACHAVIAELDQAARAWVRRQLDEQAISQPPVDPPTEADGRWPRRASAVAVDSTRDEDLDPLSVDDLLARGRQASADYDFELAARLLRAALTRSRGAPDAGLSLLLLLVDQLAAYDEALAVVDQLSRAALTDPQIRLLLGVAAAHLGLTQRAEELIDGLDDPRAIDVRVILARAALSRGDEESFARHVGLGERLGLPSLERVQLREELAAFRTARHRGAEVQLEELLAAGQEDAAEQAAQALLSLFPESKVARRVVGVAEERRRAARQQALLHEGEAAFAAGTMSKAIGFFEQALEAGADEALVRPRLAAATERDRKATAERRVASVLRLLAGDDLRAALLGYLALDPPLCARVETASPSRLLGWLAELRAGVARGGAPAAVEAVIALDEALTAFAAGQCDAARRVVAPHRALLEALAAGRKFLAALETKLDEQRRAGARQQLTEAEAALAAADLSLARSRLDQVDTRALATVDRARLAAMRDSLTAQEALHELSRQVDRLLSAGDPLAARTAVDALLARTTGSRQEHWRRRREEVSARVQQVFRLEVIDGDGLAQIPLRMGADSGNGVASPWFDQAGQHCFAVLARFDRIFVQVIEVSSSRVVQTVVLRLPRQMNDPSVLVDGGILTISGDSLVLRLELTTWQVLACDDLAPLLPTGESKNLARAFPGSSHVWIRTDDLRECRCSIVDCERRRLQREVSYEPGGIMVYGGDEPLMVCPANDGGALTYDARGLVRERLPLRGNLYFSGAAIHPDGKGIITLCTEGDWDGPLSLVECQLAEGSATDPLRIEDSDGEMNHCIATSRDLGLIYVFYISTEEGGAVLTAVRPTSGTDFHQPTQFEVVFRVPVPRDVVIAQDADARRVGLVYSTETGLGVTMLGDCAPPSVPQGGVWDHPLLQRWDTAFCSRPWEQLAREAGSAQQAELLLKGRSLPSATQLIARERQRLSGDPEALLGLCAALGSCGHFQLERALYQFAWERHPGNLRLALGHARALVQNEDWCGVRRVLEPVSLEGEMSEAVRHWHHLLGAALILDGEFVAAEELLAAGERFSGDCKLGDYREVVEPLPEQRSPANWGPERSPIRQLLGAIRTADRYLAKLHFPAVFAALHRPVVWGFQEVQSLARLTEALLHIPAATSVDRCTKTFALATYVSQMHKAPGARLGLPVPGATWKGQRLEDLARLAQQWLDEGSAE